MEVFICWSGDESAELAEALQQFFTDVIGIEPWLSQLQRAGDVWQPDLLRRLEGSQFGVLCMTPSNLNSEWLLFEAGVLFMATDKRSSKSLCPYLLGVKKTDLPSPLTMFQPAAADQKGTLTLLKAFAAVRSPDGKGKLGEQELGRFEEHWGALESTLDELRKRLGSRKYRLKRLELWRLLESHRESVIFRIQDRVRQGYLRIMTGTYDRDDLFKQIKIAIKESQLFYQGIVGARVGKDVAEFLKHNYNETHLRPDFDRLESVYVTPLLAHGRPPDELEALKALEKLLWAVETAVKEEFLKLFSELHKVEW